MTIPLGNRAKIFEKLYQDGSIIKQHNNPQFIKLGVVEQFGFNHYFNDEIFIWIDKLAETGMNGMRVFGFWPFGNGEEQEPYPRLHPHHYDLRHFHESYFEYLQRWVAYAEQKGIVVLYELFDSCAFWHKYASHHPFYHMIRQQHFLFHFMERSRYICRLTLPMAFSNLNNHLLITMQRRYIHKVITTLAPFSNVIFGIMNEYKGKKDWHFTISQYVKEQAPERLLSGSEADSSAVQDHHVNIWFVHTGCYNFKRGESNVLYDIQTLRQRTGERKILGYSTDGFNEPGMLRETPEDMRRLALDVNRAGIQLFSFLDQKAYDTSRGGFPGKASRLNIDTYRAIAEVFQPTPLLMSTTRQPNP